MARKLKPESPVLTIDETGRYYIEGDVVPSPDYSKWWLCVEVLSGLFNGYQRACPEHVQVVAYEHRGPDRVKITNSSAGCLVIDGQHTMVFCLFRNFVQDQINAGRNYFGLWEINP